MEEFEFPKYGIYSNHVSLGGIGLAVFSQGMSDEKLDALLQSPSWGRDTDSQLAAFLKPTIDKNRLSKKD